ncbi:MAG: alpha/beta fold hydrolase [Candidatus Dormibacteraeota bacterium]|nr:alpha/beta fold hydrolase [Candidatus Dormibacteraeota bacterium]
MTAQPPEDRVYGNAVGGGRQGSLDTALRDVTTRLLMRRPDRLAVAVGDLAVRQTKVGMGTVRRFLGRGTDEVLAPGDKRFAERAWQANPFLRAIAETYLTGTAWADELIEASTVSDQVRHQAHFALRMLSDAAAPSNLPWVNPTVVKEAYDTGGASVIAGFGNFLDDVANNGGRPSQVDTTGFQVGTNMAATPGRVVFRNSLIELIAYEPQTPLVHAQPILCSPPWINRFYIMDLAPGRSFVEYAVQHGFTVFMISYRNPDASMAGTTWDDYLRLGLLTALEQTRLISRSDVVNIVGLCLGGTMSTVGLAYLAAHGQDGQVGWMTLTNTLVDFSIPGELGVFIDPAGVAKLEKAMRKQGFLAGSVMAQTFDWLRGNDLVWNYVVNNWYMGKKPPAFDLLAWNGDSTNLPAAMHSQYLRSCYVHNLLVEPAAFTIENTPIDLRRIKQDLYVLGAEADHIAPWRGSYLTTQHVGGTVQYTLTSSGHVAGIVNPPGNPKAGYWSATARHGESADDWQAGAEREDGSWWEHWAAWASERSGPMVTPPPLPPGEPAPGGYVHDVVGADFGPEPPSRRPAPVPPSASTGRTRAPEKRRVRRESTGAVTAARPRRANPRVRPEPPTTPPQSGAGR